MASPSRITHETLCIGILYCKALQVTAILNTLQQTVMEKQWHYFRIWP